MLLLGEGAPAGVGVTPRALLDRVCLSLALVEAQCHLQAVAIRSLSALEQVPNAEC